jgi:hypothetical protein
MVAGMQAGETYRITQWEPWAYDAVDIGGWHHTSVHADKLATNLNPQWLNFYLFLRLPWWITLSSLS